MNILESPGISCRHLCAQPTCSNNKCPPNMTMLTDHSLKFAINTSNPKLSLDCRWLRKPYLPPIFQISSALTPDNLGKLSTTYQEANQSCSSICNEWSVNHFKLGQSVSQYTGTWNFPTNCRFSSSHESHRESTYIGNGLPSSMQCRHPIHLVLWCPHWM